MTVDHSVMQAAAPLLTGPRLALLLFGGAMVLSMIPAWAGARRDPRSLRGVGVWIKPLKFMAALALFSFTTAVLMLAAGDSQAADHSLKAIAALLIATALFEVSYITLQASRGEPSHYNSSDPLHKTLNVLMALGAIGLTGSQLWLAMTVIRHRPDWTGSVATLGVVSGLVLTFVLATVSGFMLGGKRAPPGVGLPIVGWHRRADLRPAHFLGVHAQQCIPAFGLLVEGLSLPAPLAVFAALTGAYLLAWALAIRMEWQAPALVPLLAPPLAVVSLRHHRQK